MRQPIQILVYPVKVTNGNWEYLLLHRIASRGNFWQGVTGGVEEGENILQTAQRELVEETQLIPLKVHNMDYSYTFPIEDKWRRLYAAGVEEIVEHVFVAYVDGEQDPILAPAEHDKWQWCRLHQALELLTWPENKKALQRCHNYLKETESFDLKPHLIPLYHQSEGGL